jgi:acyl-CoA thioesterase-1
MTAAAAAPLRIVAIGASNTQGWYVGKQGAYPAKLQALLKAKGIDAQVINAGVPFDTTAGMLKRIDSDVPTGTDIVILQPGANDRRFFGTKEQRAANIATMERRLRNRSIKVIVYDEEIPLRYYTFDFIHLTDEGHAMIAATLLPGSWQPSTDSPNGVGTDSLLERPVKVIGYSPRVLARPYEPAAPTRRYSSSSRQDVDNGRRMEARTTRPAFP